MIIVKISHGMVHPKKKITTPKQFIPPAVHTAFSQRACHTRMTDILATTAAAAGADSALVKDHQAYFVKSAEKVNSTLHAAICKFCHAQDVELKDNRTCLWQARDCIRHLARCPHVTESARNHFKEEARLLNARLNSKKRTFQEMNSKQEDTLDTQYQMPSSDAQPAPPTQLLDSSAEATGEALFCNLPVFHLDFCLQPYQPACANGALPQH